MMPGVQFGLAFPSASVYFRAIESLSGVVYIEQGLPARNLQCEMYESLPVGSSAFLERAWVLKCGFRRQDAEFEAHWDGGKAAIDPPFNPARVLGVSLQSKGSLRSVDGYVSKCLTKEAIRLGLDNKARQFPSSALSGGGDCRASAASPFGHERAFHTCVRSAPGPSRGPACEPV